MGEVLIYIFTEEQDFDKWLRRIGSRPFQAQGHGMCKCQGRLFRKMSYVPESKSVYESGQVDQNQISDIPEY